MHIPVLLKEALELLNVTEQGMIADVTGGGGGHAGEILKKLGPEGKLLILDRDPEAVKRLSQKFSDPRVVVRQAKFSELLDILREEKFPPLSGLLADLGVSSFQFDDPERGFSFQPGPLDMRMDLTEGDTAWDVIQMLNEKELADLFFQLAEERHSRRLARGVIAARKEKRLHTTGDLAALAEKILGRHGKIHPATKMFQALRMEVNNELGELDSLLDALPQVLAPEGRAVFISFHSLEDRRVKQKFQALKREGWKWLTKKPVTAGLDEVGSNPRSRSAKLRGIENV
ncbi:MAG: 16S rRNA (cytosine(1402)-N(4))-methyltransferase RsmH [Deltaproteobacteria bacterium]|nr:16S rRNA (cytosine(1402)-N(4))-methyltransferase RsmH [Deltaproteobacteria bacterium]